jgi:3-hydroxyacyl-[acyl-carrier-protein] dehydratase
MTELRVTIDLNHPSLSGHFPGNPIVPAVVILSEVIEAVRQTTARAIDVSIIPEAKFLSPLIPGEELSIILQQDGENNVTFTCRVGSRLVAKGRLVCRIPARDHHADHSS